MAAIYAVPEEMVDAGAHWDPRSDGEAPAMWMGSFLQHQVAGLAREVVEMPIDVKSRRRMLSGTNTVLIVESGGMPADIVEVDAYIRTLVLRS